MPALVKVLLDEGHADTEVVGEAEEGGTALELANYAAAIGSRTHRKIAEMLKLHAAKEHRRNQQEVKAEL
jgi:hypothetical protein